MRPSAHLLPANSLSELSRVIAGAIVAAAVVVHADTFHGAARLRAPLLEARP